MHSKRNQNEAVILDTWIKLARAKNTVIEAIRPVMRKHSLTLSRFGTLECLLHLGPLSQNLIGKKILVSDANIVKVIDNLERDGLVKRIAHPSDRRSKLIQLTSPGETLIKLVFEEHMLVLTNTFSVLTEEDSKILGGLCKKLGLGHKEGAQQISRN